MMPVRSRLEGPCPEGRARGSEVNPRCFRHHGFKFVLSGFIPDLNRLNKNMNGFKSDLTQFMSQHQEFKSVDLGFESRDQKFKSGLREFKSRHQAFISGHQKFKSEGRECGMNRSV
jgi:hypothetical protein